MTTAHVLGADGTEIDYDAEPRCGADFCDTCGDCLDCYSDDPCGPSEGYHAWVVYADQAADFYAKHPEAARAEP